MFLLYIITLLTLHQTAPHNVDKSTDNDDDDAANDADDDDDEQLPAARGTKRSFNDMSYEDTVVPKVKKNADGSRRRVKASDFDEISKEILITACSVYRCLIVTQAPFPDSVAAETQLAKEAWCEACQLKGVDVKLTPSAVNMVSTVFLVHSWSYSFKAVETRFTRARRTQDEDVSAHGFISRLPLK
jgi:hypothetical protein